MVCDDKLKQVINDSDNYQPIERAIADMEAEARIEQSVLNAKIEGSYSDPSKRIILDVDRASKLVGTTVPLEAFSDGEFKDVYVKKAEMIAPKMVSINDGEYVFDMEARQTRDGLYYLGSEEMGGGKEIPLQELTGTVKEDLVGWTQKMLAMDGDTISDEHKNYLMGVLEKFYDTLEQAGKDVKINLQMMKDLDSRNNTRGEANPELGKMKLVMGNNQNNSMTEVFAHELEHVMLRSVLKTDKALEYSVVQLRNLLKDHFNNKYKGEGWKVFTEGRQNPNEADAKEKFKYVFEHGRYPADEFLAYATTNEQLVKQLGLVREMSSAKLLGEVEGTGKWKKLWNNIAKAVNKMYGKIMMNNKTAAEMAMDMLDVALRKAHGVEKEADKAVVKKLLDKIAKMDSKIAQYTGEIEKEYKTYDEYVKAMEDSVASKMLNSIWKIRGMAKIRSWMLMNNLFNSVTRDMSNPEIAKFYEMFRKSKSFVEKEVVAVKNKTAGVLEKQFGLGKLSKEQRVAAKRVLLDVDAKSLGSLDEIKEYLKDDKKVQDALEELTKGMSSNVLYAVDQLAELLVHNKMDMKNGYVNAEQIALGELGARDKKTVGEIDRAVTLLAVSRLDSKSKELAVKAIDDQKDGLEKAVALVVKNEEELLKRAYYGDKMYQVKGAKQERFVDNKKVYYVEEKEMKELVKAGMMNTGEHKELSRVLGKKIHAVVGDSIDTQYTEGLMSVIQLKNEGESLKRLLMKLGEMTEEEAQEKIDELASEKGTANGAEALIPERSGNGEVYDYKLRLPYETKSGQMGLDEDLILTVAETVSNLTHKQEAMINNRAAVIQLNRVYEKYKDHKGFNFVEISKDSEGKMKEYWDMMPYYLKRVIDKNYGGKLMVDEALLVDFFGYKDVSIVNAPWIKDRVKRQVIAGKLEKIIQETIKEWKKHIVVLTPATVKGNMMSNMIVALQHTDNKNPLKYMQKFKDTWGMMNKYIADRSKLMELEIREKAGEKITAEMKDRIRAEMKANPVSALVEDGQYSSILEDVDSEFFEKHGLIGTKINKMFDSIKKENTRENLRRVFAELYIKKEGSIHDSVMKLTTYADAINKSIILQDLVEKANAAKSSGLDVKDTARALETTKEELEKFYADGTIPQKWLNKVDALHVNYGYLDNRYVKYANDAGFLTFTKYMFRVFPAMIKMLSKKAVTVMTTESIIKASGLGETPFKQFYHPLESLGRKMSLWSRPGEVLHELIVPIGFH